MKTKFDAFVIGAGFLAAVILLVTWIATTGGGLQSFHSATQQISAHVNDVPAIVSKPASVPRNIVQIQRVTWGVGSTQIDVTRRVNDLMSQRGWFVPCKEDLQNDPKTAHRKTLTVEYSVDGKPALLKAHAWSFVSNEWLLRNAGHETAGVNLQPVGYTERIAAGMP